MDNCVALLTCALTSQKQDGKQTETNLTEDKGVSVQVRYDLFSSRTVYD